MQVAREQSEGEVAPHALAKEWAEEVGLPLSKFILSSSHLISVAQVFKFGKPSTKVSFLRELVNNRTSWANIDLDPKVKRAITVAALSFTLSPISSPIVLSFRRSSGKTRNQRTHSQWAEHGDWSSLC